MVIVTGHSDLMPCNRVVFHTIHTYISHVNGRSLGIMGRPFFLSDVPFFV